MTAAQRLLDVKHKLEAACVAADRDPAEVQLVAVSKTFPEDAIHTTYAVAQRHFGENYAQELRDKGESFAAQGIEDICWHYIGRIQSNKIKFIAAHASYVHALEKLSHARALAAAAPRPIKALVSVNIASEASKGGLVPEEVLDACAEFDSLEGLEICGLMCMPPPAEDPELSAPHFARMAELAAAGRERGLGLTQLSMGMSNDFHVAVRYGATFVRVGSAIFGARKRK